MLLLVTAMALYGPVPPSSTVRSPDSVPTAEELLACGPPSAAIPATRIPSTLAVIPNATVLAFTIEASFVMSFCSPITFLAPKSNNGQQ